MFLSLTSRVSLRGARMALVATLTLGVAASAAAQALAPTVGPDFGAYPVGQAEIPLTATGGAGAYTWQVTSGSLPPGVVIRTDGPWWFPSSASAGIMGVATTPGVYPFTLTVTDGAGQTSSRACTMTIVGVVLKDQYTLPDAFVGAAYEYQMTAVDLSGAPLTAAWAATNGVPPGMTLGPDGRLSGTATAAGNYALNFSITVNGSTIYRGRSVNVYAVRITTDGTLPNATPYTAYAVTFGAAGGTPPYTYTIDNVPTGLVLESAGVLSGMPNWSTGPWTFWLTATDANGVSSRRRMLVSMLGLPRALPEVYVSRPSDPVLGSPIGWEFGFGKGGAAPFAWSVSGAPAGLSVRSGSGLTSPNIAAGNVELWGAPTQLGDFSAQLTLTDADGATTTSAVIPIHVSELAQTEGSPASAIGQPYSGKIRILGGVPPYAVAQTAGRLAAGLAFDAATMTVSGTPLESGSFGATFGATDQAGHTLVFYWGMYVAGGPSTTISVSTSYDMGLLSVGSSYSTQLSACCTPSYTWQVAAGSTLPPGLTLGSSGLLAGYPTTAGTFEFFVTAADSTNPANVAVRQLRMVVQPATTLYITNAYALPYGNAGAQYSLAFGASGGTGPMSWQVAVGSVLPPGLSLGPDGVLAGTFTGTGQFTFQIQVTDATGARIVRWFNISIYPPGQVPPLNLPIGPNLGPYQYGTVTVQLSATGGTSPYHYSMTPGAPGIPGMRLQDGQPLPTSFTGTGGFLGVVTAAGTYQTSLRVTDANGTVFDRPVTFIVSPLLLPPYSPPKATLGVYYSFTIDAPYGGSGSYAWSLSSTSIPLPAGLTLASSGLISGVPAVAAPYASTFVVTDLVTGLTRSVGYTITVDPFAIESSGVLPQATVGTPYSQALSAPGCGAACTWTISGSFTGLTLSAAGVLSGTPSSAYNQSATITATGSNGPVSKVFSLRAVTAVPVALSIANAQAYGPTVVGGAAATVLDASGGVPPYVWSIQSGSLPPGVGIRGPGDLLGSGLRPGFSYLFGRLAQIGVYSFTLAVTDSRGATASLPVTWKVTGLANQYSSLPTPTTPLTFGASYRQPLLVVGGNGVYTWQALGSMPPGLSLDGATGVVSGTPANTGSFSVPIQVDDGAGNTTSFNLSMNIGSGTAATVVFTLNSSTVQQGDSFTAFVTPSGGTPPYAVTALTPLPPGFVLETGSSVLSYTTTPPSAALAGLPQVAGTFAITLRAEDAAGNFGVRTMTMTVVPFTMLFTGTALPNASVGQPYSYPLATVGGPVTWSVGSTSALPPGLALGAGVLTGTPSVSGNYSFAVVATDGATGLSASVTYSLRVSGVSISDAGILPNATVGVPYTHTFASAGGASTPVWSTTGLPSTLSLSPTGTLTGTPTVASRYTLTVTANDGAVAFTRAFTLNVVSPIPTVLDFPISSTTFDATVGLRLLRSLSPTVGTGTPPVVWTVASGSTLPPGVQLLTGASVPATYQPGTALLAGVPRTVGQFIFDLVATDEAGAELLRTFTVNVTPGAILTGTPRIATSGAPYAQQFTAVGGTPPYTFTVRPTNLNSDMLPPGVSLSTSGLLSGTPQSTGTYYCTIQAQDSAGLRLTPVSVYVDVYNADGLQVYGSNAYSWVGAGRSMSTISAYRTNGVAATYRWSVVGGGLPPGVELVPGTTAGTVQLVGAPAQPGVYSYVLRATDEANAATYADGTLTYTVAPMQIVSPRVGISALADLPVGQVGRSYSASLKVAGGTPPYTFAVSPFSFLPPGMTLSVDGVLSGIPQGIGTYSILPLVTDAHGAVHTASSVTLLVGPPNSPAPLSRASTALDSASIGVPYGFALDGGLRGGVAPFLWSVAAGTSLPPGLAIFAGENGVPAYLSGVPTTAGTYTISLVVGDAAGQSLATTSTLVVSPLALTPDGLRPGRVGEPYPTTPFQPSGGVPPYTIQLTRGSDLPPGLSLDATGILAGTPTYAGNFTLRLTATDGGGHSLAKVYRVTIDNPAGEAPAVSVRPKPIQVYYEQGQPAPGLLPITVDSTSGSQTYTAALLGLPSGALSVAAGTAPATLQLGLNSVSALTPGSYTGLLGVGAPGSANGFDWAPITLTVALPQPCMYALSAPGATASAQTASYSFTVWTAPGCSWSATSSNPAMLTITGAASGSGRADISYTVSSNPLNQRSGTIRVNGLVFTVTQFGLASCSYALMPATRTAPAVGGTVSVDVVASSGSCPPWTSSSSDLVVTPGAGSGTQHVGVAVPVSSAPAPRTLTATIAGKALTINQDAASCSPSLSAYAAAFAASGGSGDVTVTMAGGCPFAAEPGGAWISIVSGGSGTGTGSVVYSVMPNSTTVPRSGTLTIGDQKLQITQEPQACSVTLDTTGLGSPYGTGTTAGTIGVMTNGSNCSWTAASTAPWATVFPASGSGPGSVTVSVESNAGSADARSATVSVAGPAVRIQQAGTTCTYALQSEAGTVPAAGGSASVGVVAPGPCGWAAASNNPDWLTITASGSAGSSEVQFVARPNPDPAPRVGTLTVAGLTYTVSQAAAPCGYALAQSGTMVAAEGASPGDPVSGSVAFTAGTPGCVASAVSYAGWIAANTVQAGTDGAIQFTVAANPTGYARTGTIQLGDRTFTIVQNGGACAYSLREYGAFFGGAGGNGSVFASQGAVGCSPVVGTTQPGMVTIGPLSGPYANVFTQPYAVSGFSSLNPVVRLGTITFGGVAFTVKQRSW